MAQKPLILVVDDEVNIRLSLKDILSDEGYEVVTAENGEIALVNISQQHFDLALLDLKLPGIGGIEVLKALRRESPETVTIVLTAYGTLESAVEALRYGAHDYLFKPCKPSELRESASRGWRDRQAQVRQRDLLHQLKQASHNLENIRASIMAGGDRPVPSLEPQGQAQSKRFLQFGDVVVDRVHHLISLNDRCLDLSRTEFDLLAYLVSQAPRVVSSQELTREVQGYESEQWEARDLIRSHIYHIRQKVKRSLGRTDFIRTVRGVGYTIYQS